MRIGNTRIAGVSRRFYILLATTVVLIFVVLHFAPKTPPSTVGYVPAFSLTNPLLENANWINGPISTYGLQLPAAETDFVGPSYSGDVGLPFRMNVYIYDPSDVSANRPDLQLIKDGYTFEPAKFLPTNQLPAPSLDSLQSGSITSDSQPLELGFRTASRSAGVPTPDNAYQLTGVLWWRSDLLSPLTAAEQQNEGAPLASPVFIVSSYAQLSPAELSAPATARDDLNLIYQEDGETVDINRIEWSPGNEMRVCLTVTNDTTQPQQIWAGVNSMTADINQGTVPGSPDDTTALASTSLLQPDQRVPGYIDFPASVSEPNVPLILRMPSLGTGPNQQNDSISINVPVSAMQSVTSAQQQPTTSCN